MEEKKQGIEYDEILEYDEEFEDVETVKDGTEDASEKGSNTTVNVTVKKGRLFSIILLVVIALLVGGLLLKNNVFNSNKDTIETTSDLQEVVKISELSSYQIVYNGVAKKYSKDKELLYYVSYDSKVKAGVDTSDIKIEKERKTIKVTLPEIKITDYNVDIGSLDYIFTDSDAENEVVSSEAYKLCIKDVKKETENNDALYASAKANAVKIVKSLIEPLVQQQGYKVIVQ